MYKDDESDDNSENVFFFESDHLALRGNSDYTNMLRTIAVLEAQKIKTHKDIEELIICKNEYLSDPQLLTKKLADNEEIISPNYMTIATIPEVGSYVSNTPECSTESSKIISESADQLVRGRLFDQTKPETFNQLWTCEEQRRLEQLLVEFPVEPVEMRRFTKIANALGNRTPQQVASRVQKFFKKLYSAGMPVPGRIPKSRRNCLVKSKHYYKSLYRPSTFFPAHNVPFNIPEDDFNSMDMQNFNSSSTSESNNHCTATFFSDLNDAEKAEGKKMIIHMLKVIREEKCSPTPTDTCNPNQQVMKCENCLNSPITGTRWHCNSCYNYINNCSDCIVSQLISNKFEHFGHDVVESN